LRKKVKLTKVNKKFKIEELLENIPDYINGKIKDEELKNAINSEIITNPEFKNEFDSLNSTLKSINNFTFIEPPDYYFNNLLPQINEKINAESKLFNFKKNFSAIWKIALPVTAVLLIFIVYKTYFKNNEYVKNTNNDSQIVLNNDFQEKIRNKDSISKNEENISSIESEETDENNNIITNVTKSYYSKQEYTEKNKIINIEENNNVAIDISENTPDDDVFFSNEEEPNIEQEFDKLNSEEQNKILSEIKNSKL